MQEDSLGLCQEKETSSPTQLDFSPFLLRQTGLDDLKMLSYPCPPSTVVTAETQRKVSKEPRPWPQSSLAPSCRHPTELDVGPVVSRLIAPREDPRGRLGPMSGASPSPGRGLEAGADRRGSLMLGKNEGRRRRG